MIIPSAEAMFLIPSTAKSRMTMMATTQAGILPMGIIRIMAVLITSLSAMGSKNFPNVVTIP